MKCSHTIVIILIVVNLYIALSSLSFLLNKDLLNVKRQSGRLELKLLNMNLTHTEKYKSTLYLLPVCTVRAFP